MKPRELWTYIRKTLGYLGLTLKDLEDRLGVDDFVDSFYASELTRTDVGGLAEIVSDRLLLDLAHVRRALGHDRQHH